MQIEKSDLKSEERGKESIGPDVINRETIEKMKDEPKDGREEGYTRYLAVARTIETDTTYVLFVDTGGTHGVERGYPLPLEWEAIPRSVVVEKDPPKKLPVTGQKAVAGIIKQYKGIKVDEDSAVDWRISEGDR